MPEEAAAPGGSEDRDGEPGLRRELSTAALTIYGVGVIVGAGIYVLLGEVVAGVGAAAWAVFLGAALAALPTGLAYAELASRYPESAGEAVFARRAFGRADVSFLVGFLVVASGVASVAAVAHGFADYFVQLVGPGASRPLVVLAFLAVLSLVNWRGIRETTWINATCTVLSVGALLVLALAGIPRWGEAAANVLASPVHVAPSALLGTIALAFYAFIGFEDICNVADEARTPSRSIPRAILLSLSIATGLYLLVAITAVAVVPVGELASDPAPLAGLAARLLPGVWPGWLSLVALLAVTNTALFNLVMTSRVVYGMARRGLVPRLFADVDPRRRTPRWAVVLAFVMAATLAVTGALGVLARATNVVILLAFAAVNLSLLVVRLRDVPPDVPPAQVFRVPLWVPGLGLVTTAVLLGQLSLGAWLRAAAVVGVGVVLYVVARAGARNAATRSDRASANAASGVAGPRARATVTET